MYLLKVILFLIKGGTEPLISLYVRFVVVDPGVCPQRRKGVDGTRSTVYSTPLLPNTFGYYDRGSDEYSGPTSCVRPIPVGT